MRPRSFIGAAALAGAIAIGSAAPAAAQSASARVYGDYVAHGGVINPCIHTSEQLRAAQQEVTPDIEQYSPDYPAAIAAAIKARARGDCAGKKPLPNQPAAPAATPVVPTPTPTPVPTAIPTKTVVPEPPAPMVAPVSTPAPTETAREDVQLERVAVAAPANDAPAPVFLLALLAAVLTTAALFLAAMQRLGVGDERMAPVGHAWREFGWRLEGLWGDFRDWLKIGR